MKQPLIPGDAAGTAGCVDAFDLCRGPAGSGSGEPDGPPLEIPLLSRGFVHRFKVANRASGSIGLVR